MLATGVAALAITAPAASAPQGGGHDRTAHAAKAQQGGGGGGETRKAKRDKAKAQRAETREQRSDTRQQRVAARDRTDAKPTRAETRRVAADRAEARQRVVERRADAERRADRRDTQVRIREDAVARADARKLGRNNNPVVTPRERQAARLRALDDRDTIRIVRDDVGYGVGGCPPGLAKKPVRCMPPGQAAKLVNAPLAQAKQLAQAQRLAALSPLPVRLQSIYPDTPNYYYTYGNGYVYRVNRTNDVISALLPLFGAGYTVGQSFPMSYPSYYMPSAYQPFYPSTPYYDYRYANGYIYEVDPFTGRIVDVDPMLGYGYGYGQMMPVTYSAYNVPYQYRPLYYDTSDYYYRYAPGAIYQVDPTTSLITAVAALLTGGLNVGQPLPMGYSAYNVPYAYRTTYYDTPNDWYRYSNGYVYRVDPSTMLVTAIVASALT
jgi:hypothetical protein